jgi:hypothetical protein
MALNPLILLPVRAWEAKKILKWLETTPLFSVIKIPSDRQHLCVRRANTGGTRKLTMRIYCK